MHLKILHWIVIYIIITNYLDLPQLETIVIGYHSLFGEWGEDSCSLVMTGNDMLLNLC